MSTIVEILRATEEVLLPDGSRVLASVWEREEALRQTLRESLRRERQKRKERQGHQRLLMQRAALASGHSDQPDARSPNARSPDACSPDARSGGARDMDMGHPVVQVVGQANTRSANSVRSAKSAIVPEPDQIQSK